MRRARHYRVLAVALLLSIVLPLALPALVSTGPKPVASAESGWTLVVIPYFLQDYDSASGEDRYVFLYAYERIQAVIDLNHNGVPDPREPEINITWPGKLLYIAIGTPGGSYNRYLSIGGDIGSLWLLVKTPVTVSYFAVGTYGLTMAYNAPPPGTEIVVPPIRGNVYVSPADPRGANVTVEGGPHDGETYRLNATDYLVLNVFDEPFTLHSDRPIAAVLVNRDSQGYSSFAVELVPQEDKYMLDNAPPMPGAMLENPVLSHGEPKAYYYIISRSGNVYTGEYVHPTPLHDIANTRGIAYILFEYTNPLTGKTTLAAAPYYKLSQNPCYEGSIGFISRLSVEEPYSASERMVRLFLAPTEPPSEGELFVALPDGDWEIDVVASVMLGRDDVFPVRAPHGEKSGVILYTTGPGIALPVQFIADGGYKAAAARLLLYPIPWDLTRFPDLPGFTPNATNINWSTSGIPGVSGFTQSYPTSVQLVDNGTLSISIQFSLSIDVESESVCSTLAPVLVLYSSSLQPVAYSARVGCEASVSTTIVDPDMGYILSYYIIHDDSIHPLGSPAISVAPPGEGVVPGVAPDYTPTLEDEGVHHMPSQLPPIGMPAEYYAPNPSLDYPEDYIATLSWLLGTQLPPEQQEQPPGGGETGEPGTQTPPEGEGTTTSPPGGEGGQSPSAGGEAESPPSTTTSLPLGLSEGQTITYTFSIEGAGPNGSVSGSGKAVLRVEASDGRLVLRLALTTIPEDARSLLALVVQVSDLYHMVFLGEGAESEYTMAGENVMGDYYECPILDPGAGTTEKTGTVSTAIGIPASYKCKYTNGILASIETSLEGQYAGHSISVNIKAGAEGVPGSGAGGESAGGRGILLYAVIAVVVAALALVILRLRR